MNEIPLSDLATCWPPPERVVMVTSADAEGNPNIISVGWIMRANMNPPAFAIGLGMRSRSCRDISASGEFVVAVAGVDLAKEVMYCGTRSGSEVDKFKETGLTAVPGKTVKAPLIGECMANVECKVIATQDMHDHRVFFGEALACWTSDKKGKALLIVGDEDGYELILEEAGFRLGTVKG